MIGVCVGYLKRGDNIPRKYLYSTCCYKRATIIRFNLVLMNWDRIAFSNQQTFCQLGYQFRDFFCF